MGGRPLCCDLHRETKPKAVGSLELLTCTGKLRQNSWRFRRYGGTPCSTTIQQGDIIVGTLEMNGTAGITMDLVPYGFLEVRQVALVC